MRRTDLLALLKETRKYINDTSLAMKIDEALTRKQNVEPSTILVHQKEDTKTDRWIYLVSDGPVSFGFRNTEEQAKKDSDAIAEMIRGKLK